MVDPLAVLRPQTAIGYRKYRLGGVLLIVPLDRVANRLHAAIEPAGDPTMHVGRAGPGQGKPSGPCNDPIVLFLRELAEAAAPIDPDRVVADKLIDGTGEETDPPAASDKVTFRNEAMIPPP